MKKKSIIIVSVLLLISIGIFVTYAFISTGGKQTLANSFTSGCLSITIDSESPSININGAFPVTDVEGLKGDSYSFTIRNTCNQDENYMINLESLNHSPNSLNPIYIKTALSSDTFDNIITKLNSDIETDHYIEGTYISHNLYDGTIKASETKTFNLKLWMDYDTTTEQGLNKTYQSRINVIASSKATPDDISEVLTEKKGKTVEGTITGSATSANYCTSTGNACEPNKAVDIADNKIKPTLEDTEKEQIVCTKLDDKKVVCSNPVNNKYCPAGASSCESILADIEPTDTEKITGPSCNDNEQCGETNMNQNGIYMAEDDDGTSYVYRGTIDNNWFKFGQTTNGEDIWWRIIRINGDGTIRLIYAGEGTAPSGNGQNIETTKTKYNSQSNDNTYVGYYTGVTGETDFSKTHSNTTQSTVAARVETWFSSETNLHETAQLNNIDENAGFCNNRQISEKAGEWYTSEESSNRGTGTVVTAYKGRYNTFDKSTSWRTDVNYANLKCSSSADDFEENTDYKRDYYTWKTKATRGNKALDYPVGQITVDEVILAGGFGGQANSGYWLNSGTYYWTMSPRSFDNGSAIVFVVWSNGRLSTGNVDNTNVGVRPVINLKSDLKLLGNGTKENPYRIDERDKLQEAGTTILANNELKGVVSSITGPSCIDETCYSGGIASMQQNGLYEATDDDGTSYIFRGTIDNNWVKFGKDGSNNDIWWRIIRINGNGSLRLIYTGVGSSAPSTTVPDTNAVSRTTYNTKFNDNTYVGYYTVDTENIANKATSSYVIAHNGDKKSTIAEQVDTWFIGTNLKDQAQLKHIDENAGFCNDREIAATNHGYNNYTNEGYGDKSTWYAPFDRLAESDSSNNYSRTKQYPTLKCKNKSRDLYTWKGHAKEGNKKLENPVGLITMDEPMFI